MDSAASLVVASLDLQLVRLLRDAIRTADLSSGGACCPPGAGSLPPAAIVEPRRRIEPEPVYEPRRHIHPTPRYEPRRVVRLPGSDAASPACACCPDATAPTPPASSKSPIEPPWKVLPWEELPPCPPAKIVKVAVAPPDSVRKGKLIDLFI